jgi:lysophospholipase L1-like esterase
MTSEDLSPKNLPENQGLSNPEIRTLFQASMKFKSRSHDTHHSTHLPELTSSASGSMNVVFIGDSMFERLKTTGINTKLASLPTSFNAGIGGDKIENVLYRLDLGLLDLLEKKNVKLWVVMVGTNNLKKALKGVEVERYRLLLQALLRIAPKSRVFVCGVFRRKDIDDQFVESSNEMLRGLVDEMNGKLAAERLSWVEAPVGITKDRLADHVHLDEEGYKIWDETLYPKIEELLGVAGAA